MTTKTREELRQELIEGITGSGVLAANSIDHQGKYPMFMGKPIDWWIELATWLEQEEPSWDEAMRRIGCLMMERDEATRRYERLHRRIKELL